jgi:hypothetical protein
LWIPPKYFERGTNLEKDLPDLLTDVVKDILANHQPELLPDKMVAEIEQYLASL